MSIMAENKQPPHSHRAAVCGCLISWLVRPGWSMTAPGGANNYYKPFAAGLQDFGAWVLGGS